MAQKSKGKTMSSKKNQNKSSQMARAYMLSFPQLMVWAIIFAFVGGLTVWTGMAAPHNRPGGGGNGGTLSLGLVKDNNGDGLPNWNDTITYNVSTTVTPTPFVSTNCYKDNVLVANTSAGFFDSYPWPDARQFALASQVWTSGAADCKAVMFYANGKKTVTLATLNFHVNP